MAARLSISDARENLSDIMNRVRYRGERVILRRHNRDVAAVVPIEDLEALQRMEDEADGKDALKARKEPGAIPGERVKKKARL